MPTFDVPVHELVIKTTELNGCHTDRRSKPRTSHYWAPDTTFIRSLPTTHAAELVAPVQWVRIEDRMSQSCRNYYLWNQPCCAGCKEPKDVEYADKMKELEK